MGGGEGESGEREIGDEERGRGYFLAIPSPPLTDP
jgi:hypothetical protein